MRKVIAQIYNAMGPILISALSIFITFILLHPLATFLDPTFNLLASRGTGKVAFVTIVIYQILLFLLALPKDFFDNFLKINIYFFAEKNWFLRFSKYFLLFFTLHSLVIYSLYSLGYLIYFPGWGQFNFDLIIKLFWGFIVVFMLAWTEELIFRGTIYPYFLRFFKPITSLFLTSIIFMISHNICDSLDIKKATGLFLLGMMLNLIFIKTEKLYTGMGAHSGLVFVKVIFRRAPFLIFLPSKFLPFWVSSDLRTSYLIHLLFLIVISILFYLNRKKLFS